MVSKLRFVVCFLSLDPDIRKKLEKEYYAMVWGENITRVIKDLHACYSKREGGLGCFDLNTIAIVSAVAAVARAMQLPNLAWPQIVKELIIEDAQSKTASPLIRGAINMPWIQQLCPKPTMPSEFAFIWNRWKTLIASDATAVV
ncbi:hypothetical protein N431DRAFT_446816 [Stipitochalara longipes BDJ]|nr:hypothetical protein N431DRAFT_446816 [Stipitochalara longipes BDJ]